MLSPPHETHFTESSVEVIIRLQPPQNECLQLINSQSLTCLNRTYNFDYIFPHFSTQDSIFQKIGLKMIASAKKGYNSCIFAYGQTGSGKTYTMTGKDREEGLIQKTMMSLIKALQSFQSYELKMSYFQIYNEQINDLLALISTNGKKKQKIIKIKQSVALGFYVQNLLEIKVQGSCDLMENLQKGLKNRTTAETKMNRQSSRSHSILTLHIQTRDHKQNSEGFCIRTSKMHFVDLAGSQKQKSTLASGDRLKQASSINKSLTSLSIVIQKLSSKATHIPYRDSVITKILRDSLGGNSKTILIATLSSKQESIYETISTINFAAKAKRVKLSARINEEYDGSPMEMRKRIKQLESQIRHLKNKEVQQVKCSECAIVKSQFDKLEMKFFDLEQEISIKQHRIKQLQMLLYKFQEEHEKRESNFQYVNNEESTFKSEIKFNNFDIQVSNGQMIDDQQNNNNNNLTIIQDDYCSERLTVINQDEAEQQVTITDPSIIQISRKVFQNQKNRQNRRFQRKSQPTNIQNPQDKNQQISMKILQMLKVKELAQKNIVLQSQIRLLKLHIQQIQSESRQREEANRKVYQPIVRQWMLDNKSMIKNKINDKNSIQRDIILGMQNKFKECKFKIIHLEQEIEKKDVQHQLALQKVKQIHEQYSQKIVLEERSRILSTYLNRSKQKIRSEPQTQRLSLDSQKKSHFSEEKNIQSQQSLKHLQQQLDRQQLLKETIVQQLQNYKIKCTQLEQQIQKNTQMAAFWQQKYDQSLIIKKQIEEEKQKIMTIMIQQNEKSRQVLNQHDEQFGQVLENEKQLQMKIAQLQRRIRQNQGRYKVQVQMMHERLNNKVIQNDELLKAIKKYENEIILQKDTTLAKSEQIQNMRKNLDTLQKTIKKIEQIKKDKQRKIQEIQKQMDRLKQNIKYTTEDFKRKMQQKQRELQVMQRQSSKQYMQMIESQQSCKLTKILLSESQQMLQRIKLQKQRCSQKLKNMCAQMSKQQSETYSHIQKLNEQKREYEFRNEKLQNRITYLINEYKKKSDEINYLKQQCKKQKQWSQQFKKMQDQFIGSKNRQKMAQTRRKKQQILQNQLQSIIDLQQSKKIKSVSKDIVNKLSQICGIQWLDNNNLLTQLDKIYQQVSQFRKLKQQNNSLKAKNKLLLQKRNSDFWSKID